MNKTNIWCVRGVSELVRAETKKAARKKGVYLGQYISEVLIEKNTITLARKVSVK